MSKWWKGMPPQLFGAFLLAAGAWMLVLSGGAGISGGAGAVVMTFGLIILDRWRSDRRRHWKNRV